MNLLKQTMFQKILALGMGIFLLSSCARNPVTGKQDFMLLTESDEIKMGQQADKEIVQMYGVYEDAKLSAYLDNMGQKMALISHRPHLKYEFKVMDSPVINAFAVPGGYVYITRGILAYLNNEAELAGVVGHEIGHITARHSAKKYSEAQIAQLGLGVGSMISDDFASIVGLAAQGLGLLFLKFSRDDERQSDVLGVDYATKVEYDAREMANFFTTLDKMQKNGKQGGIPDWFSTHPNPASRVGDVRNEAISAQKKAGKNQFIINRDEYLAMVDGLIFGENPRQGFVDKENFYHPDLQFYFPVPAGWQLTNLPSQVQMVSADKKGLMLFTLATENSPAAASKSFIEKSKVQVAAEKRMVVNNLDAYQVYSEVKDGATSTRIQSLFIEKNGKVYVFHGFADRSNFDSLQPAFSATMNGFQTLKDKSILNVKPDHMVIKKAGRNGTMRQVLSALGVAEKDIEETALINGRGLEEKIDSQSRIKIISRGR